MAFWPRRVIRIKPPLFSPSVPPTSRPTAINRTYAFVRQVRRQITVRAGGTGQPVIKLTADVMGAGYTMAVSAGNPTTNGTTVKAGSKAFGLFNLFNMFPDKKSAQDYITEVVGETVATTTDTGAKTTTPGHGYALTWLKSPLVCMPFL